MHRSNPGSRDWGCRNNFSGKSHCRTVTAGVLSVRILHHFVGQYHALDSRAARAGNIFASKLVSRGLQYLLVRSEPVLAVKTLAPLSSDMQLTRNMYSELESWEMLRAPSRDRTFPQSEVQHMKDSKTLLQRGYQRMQCTPAVQRTADVHIVFASHLRLSLATPLPHNSKHSNYGTACDKEIGLKTRYLTAFIIEMNRFDIG